MAGDRVQRNRERVGEHRLLVGHRIRNRKQHAVMCRHQFGVAAGHVGRHPGMDSGFDVAVGEAPAQAVVTTSHAGQGGWIPRGPQDSHGLSTTRCPTCSPRAFGPTRTTSATTSWPMTCGNEQKAAMALSVSPSPKSSRICLESDPQTPGQPRPRDHPIVMQKARLRNVQQRSRGMRQILRQCRGITLAP